MSVMNQLREDCSKRSVTVRGVPPGLDLKGILQGLRAEQKDPSTWLVLFHNEERARFFISTRSQNFGGFVLQYTASRGSDIPDDWLQDDSSNSSGTQMPAYPAGYMVYPNQFIPGQPPMPQPPTSQGQQHQPYGNPYNLGGAGHQLQYPHTPDRKVPLAEGPQVVPTDPVSAKASFEPTVYMNYPNYLSRSNPEPQTNAPPSYESHDFTPQVPARLPKKPPVFPHGMAVSGPGHPHTMGSVQKSSDSESMRTNEQEEPSPKETRSIKVSLLPDISVNEDFITDFFENQKNGGGDVAEVDYDQRKNTAIVTFEDSKVVKSVLERQEFSPLKMNKVEIQIEEFYPQSDESEGEIEVSAILVTNLPPNVTDQQIELFFENSKKSGGGEVQRVEYDKEARSAIVTFKDAEVVPKVLQKHETSPLMINKQKVDIEEYHPPQDESGESSEEEHEEAGAIKVTKLPPGTTEEAITLFFETRKRSGGGEVEKVEYDEANHSAVVWFTEAEAVSRVLQKVPLLFNKKQIHVEEVRLDGQKVEKEEEDSRGPLCTIEVRGMKDTTSKDSVEFYFENKRSGGGDVEEVKGEVEDGVLLVTFVDEKTVEKVLQRSHKLDGATLQVKLYEPPKPIPMYPNRVLIKNLNPETSKEGIINYLEAKTGDEVTDVAFGQEEGTVLVTFEELTDFNKLEKACQRKPLENCYLSVKRVPISNCICVSGFSKKTSESTLEYYFENERKSGGKDVTDVKFNDEDNTCLVYFEDHAVCDIVCKKSHVVDNQNLTVQIYHDCLGQPFNPEEGPRFKTPNPLIIRELNLRKMKFVYKSPEFKEILDKQASMGHGKIKWPEKPAAELTVECTLTKDVPDCRKLVKTWEKDMENGIKRLLEELQVELISVLQELWQKVLEEIKKVNVADPTKVAMVIEKGTFTIVIVGYKQIVESLKKTLQQIISAIEDEIQKQKQQITEKLPLKHYQFLLLSFDHFKEATEKKYPGLKVTTNLKDRTVTLEGQYSDVTQAKISLYERCHEICEASAGKFSKNRMDYLKRKEVKSKVSTMLKEKDNMSCFEFKGDEVMLYAFSDDKAVEAAHLLKDNITESPIEVQSDSAYLLSSDKWEHEVKNIQSREEFKGLLHVITLSHQNKIIIVTFRDLVGLAREFVENYLRDNTILSDSMDVHPSIFKYLQLHHSKLSEELSNRFRDKQVQVTSRKNSFTVKGTQTGLNQAMFELDKLIKMIMCKKHTLQKPGITKHLKSEAGTSYINKVQKQNRCYIQIGEKTETNVASSKSTGSGFGSNGTLAEHTTKSGIIIKVHGGDLTQLPVDVIVNGANTDLKHQGGLAGVLVKKGGIEIQKECTEHVKRNKKLSEGEIFCSKPGTLSCKMIVHACGPTWKGGFNQESDHLTECVQSALEETDKLRFRSIAFPALCTGIFGYPIKQATTVIVKAVRSYLKDKKVSSIKEIILCDMKAETVKSFTEALQQAYKGKVKVFSKNIPEPGPQPEMVKGYVDQKGSQDPEFSTGNISVKLIRGQIAKAKVDVIVNTASSDLNLSQGAVSASIVKYGGDSIQQECQSKYPNGINPGEIASTSGGKLDCKMVCHGALPPWDKDKGEAKKILQTFVKSCLQEGHNQNMSTIAFPAMGTGNLGYPRDVVAEEMCTAIVDFSKENTNTCLKKVLFVVYEKDLQTIQAFETQIKKMAKKGHNSKARPRHGKLHKEEEGFVMLPELISKGDGDQKEVSVDIGKLKLRMYQGDITRADVDVIVNGTDPDMDLSKGGVSQAIKSKLGDDLQRQIELQRENMKKQGIAVTANGSQSKIPSQFIIHVNVMDGHFKKRIMEALKKTEEMKLQKVALPAIGTVTKDGHGYHSQSIEDFADEVYSALNKIQSDVKHLSEVHVVIYEHQMAQKFIIAMQNCFVTKGAKPKGFMEKIVSYLPGSGFKGSGPKPSDQQWNPVIEDKRSSVTIVVYAEGQGDIDKGIESLENLLDKDFHKKVFQEKDIHKFTPSQMKALQDLSVRYDVEVEIDKDQGKVVLFGPKDELSLASDSAHTILREADRHMQNQAQARLISDYVQWSYIDTDGDNSLKEYPRTINLIIETAYRNQEKEARFSDENGTEYIINFSNMEEYPSDDVKDVASVIRRDKVQKSSFELPKEWSTMEEKDNLMVVQIKSGTSEYSGVIDRFHGQVGKREIVKLERIQNKMLYQQYLAKKKLLDSQNPQGTKNERDLWHGTAPDAVNSINSFGFNRSYCGRNATAFGDGVYFAVNAGYSASDTYSKPDPQGLKRMYLCNVLTGEYTKGQSGMRVPPTKPGQQAHILYDSVVENPTNPGMFIIFNDTQAYPSFLITFK
uniref:Poly [ADP-ribose] polymerase n=1 Tax=Crassostrea virginica TaxID=6565 RepID=A0A8B8E892_CRAVI|nr:poly [ADP-ribose] polymerase 14-like isoform X3 [Crassostrea virginica]